MRRSRPAAGAAGSRPAAGAAGSRPAVRPVPPLVSSGRSKPTAGLTAATALALLTAGCGGAAAASHSAATASPGQLPPPRQTCGTSHTAINVPVIIEVEKGSVPCLQAMHIQASYTKLVQAGRVSGNGGGSPVQADGWTCQGTDTTTTVQTGEAFECRKGATEIVAVLKLQSQGPGG